MFTVGFTKVAMFDHNNQGLEYNMSDNTNATSNVGPGGMSPQGIESYQPIPKQPDAKPKARVQTDSKKEKFNIATFLMHKGASVRGNAGANDQKDVPGWTNNQEQAQKYDSSTVDATPDRVMSSIQEERERIKKYKRISKR